MIGKLQPWRTVLCDINVVAIKPMKKNPRKQRCCVYIFPSFFPQNSSSCQRAEKKEVFLQIAGAGKQHKNIAVFSSPLTDKFLYVDGEDKVTSNTQLCVHPSAVLTSSELVFSIRQENPDVSQLCSKSIFNRMKSNSFGSSVSFHPWSHINRVHILMCCPPAKPISYF